MSDPTAYRLTQVEDVIRTFGWGDYGMHDPEIGLNDDPDAQEWVPDLAVKILARIDAL